MPEDRRQDTGDVHVGNSDSSQPADRYQDGSLKDKNRPLISAEYGPVVAAAITAAASLLVYAFNQIRHIDERLDSLEQEAKVLIGGDGKVRPSMEALEAKYHLEALLDRIKRVEDKLQP